MKKYLCFFALCMCFQSASANTQNEIAHLLSFVAGSECTYERNGKFHTAAEAKKHIQKKFKYFEDDINSAEDFIKYSATKSKMSGKYYLIHCPELPVQKSKDWLLNELQHYRDSLSIKHSDHS